MENILIKDLYRNTEKYLDNEVQISGWVKTVRDSKNFGFIEVNDGSFFKNVQVVFTDSLSNFEDVRKLTISSSIIVTGKLVKTENAKLKEDNDNLLNIVAQMKVTLNRLITQYVSDGKKTS